MEAIQDALYWLREEAWAKIAPHLPHGRTGCTAVDDRRVMSGILHVLPRRIGTYQRNRKADRRRNRIECMFCRLKDWQRLATRSDRRARNYRSAFVLVATVCCWAN